MKDAQPHAIEMTSDMVEFLKAAAKEHGLDDIGKAVRCLVNYARENPDKGSEIFGDVRCLDC
jgi:hypothetical protein